MTIILIFLITAIGISRLTLVIITVEGTSMLPTLQQQDHLLVFRCWPARWLRRGQIVIFSQYSKEHQKFVKYIKRVTALPGETAISHAKLPLEIYPPQLRAAAQDRNGKRIWKMPPGYFFVVGDNPNSADSKQLGPFHLGYFVGIVLVRLPRTR